MKKKLYSSILISVITLFLSKDLYSQVSYAEDAVFLASCLEPRDSTFSFGDSEEELEKKGKFRAILKHLGNFPDMNFNSEDVKTKFEDNPYLYPFLKAGIPLEVEKYSTSESLINGFVSQVGNIDVTNLVDGLAKFFVERTKQELSITFFSRLTEFISKEEFKDARTLFPQSYKTLMAISNDIYDYNAYILSIKSSFQKDLSSVLDNLPGIIDNHEKYFSDKPELKASLYSAFQVANEIKSGHHPGEIIENFPTEYWINCNKNYEASFSTLKLFSRSLKGSSEDHYWTDAETIQKLIKNPFALQIFLGLIYEDLKNQDIIFDKDISVKKTLYDRAKFFTEDMPKLKTFINEFASKTKVIEGKIANIKELENDSLRFEEYYGLINSAIDLIRFVSKIEELPYLTFLKEFDLKEKTLRHLDIIQLMADLAYDIKRKEYSSLIINIGSLYDKIFTGGDFVLKYVELTDKIKELEEKHKDVIKSISELKKKLEKADKDSKEYGTIKIDIEKKNLEISDYITLVNEQKWMAEYSSFLNGIFKYGSFMASIARAKTSDEVKSVIESFAMPVGSARIKRQSTFNVSLNGYCGLYTGYEKIVGLDSVGKINTYGITAPLGIAASWGLGKKCRSSVSMFLSVVDIGVVTSFRFKDSTTAQIPTIQLKDIFSPGLFLSYGIPNSPISLNFGAQAGPNLREVNVTSGNSYANSMYWRYSISILVDIPVLNFYTKPRK
jgi:hypothetical protein